MTMRFALEGAFSDEQALRGMIAQRKVCFDHEPFYVQDGTGHLIQIGFQLNLYAAFQDPQHLPSGDDAELNELVGDLHRLCRVFFQSLDLLKPCRTPHPPMHRILYAPEHDYRAEVCLQIPIFDRTHYGANPDRRLAELLATAECLLRQIGASSGKWEDRSRTDRSQDRCEAHALAATEEPPPRG